MAADLSQYFNNTNPFMWDAGYQQIDNERAKSLADIANMQSQTNIANTMLPANLAHTQALAGQAKEATRQMSIKNDTEAGVPTADRTKAYWSDLLKKQSDNESGILANNMEALRYYTSKASQPGGLTLEDTNTVQTKYPGLAQFLKSPETIKAGQRAYDDYVTHSDAYRKAALQAAAHVQGAAIGANATLTSIREQIAAGKFQKPWMVSELSRIDLEHDPAKKQAMLIDLATKAGSDTPEAQQLLTRAAALDNAVKLQRGAAVKPGTTDKGALGIPVNPGSTGMPNNAKPGSSPDNPIILK